MYSWCHEIIHTDNRFIDYRSVSYHTKYLHVNSSLFQSVQLSCHVVNRQTNGQTHQNLGMIKMFQWDQKLQLAEMS